MNEASDAARDNYFVKLDELHTKLQNSRAMLDAARTLGASMTTIELWQRIVAQDQREIIMHRDNRTTQSVLP